MLVILVPTLHTSTLQMAVLEQDHRMVLSWEWVTPLMLISGIMNLEIFNSTSATARVTIDSWAVTVSETRHLRTSFVLTTGTTDTLLHLTTGGASDNGDATNSIRFTGGNNTRWANAKYGALIIYSMVMLLSRCVSMALGVWATPIRQQTTADMAEH